jgi:hypothetical protein
LALPKKGVSQKKSKFCSSPVSFLGGAGVVLREPAPLDVGNSELARRNIRPYA